MTVVRPGMIDGMHVASILFAMAGLGVEVYAVWHANHTKTDLNYLLLGTGVALICVGLILLTLGAGGPLESG